MVADTKISKEEKLRLINKIKTGGWQWDNDTRNDSLII